MKPIAKNVMLDKQAEATTNALYEDIYNWLDKWREQAITGKLDRPIINKITTGTVLCSAWIWAHCTEIKDAAIYVWGIRVRYQVRWDEWWTTTNEVTFKYLAFDTEYEFRVKVYGRGLINSEWSPTVLWLTLGPPTPSKVANVTVVDNVLFDDPTTGASFASITVDWNPNPDDEGIDLYEIIWTEASAGDSVLIGMNVEDGRTVKLGITPFTRLDTLDYWVSDEWPARCYAISVDFENGIAYVGINDTDDTTTGPYVYIYKVDIATMTILDTLTLSSGSYTKHIDGLCGHPENGFIYALVVDNVGWASSTLYEIRISDFTITRQVTPSPHFAVQQTNYIYPDAVRGYIYYPKYVGSATELYTQGTAQTDGTNIVSGFGTEWLDDGIVAGDIFYINSIGIWNYIAEVVSNTILILAGTYTDSGGYKAYTIRRVPIEKAFALRRFDLTTFTDDVVYTVPLPGIGTVYGHWGVTDNCAYDKTNGKMYVAWVSGGLDYNVAHYTLGEIDVDAGTILRTLQLPTLPSGYALQPRRMCISSSHVYLLCVDQNPVIPSPPPYLATVSLSTFTLVGYPQCPSTTGDGNTIFPDSNGGDIQVSGNSLFHYNHASSHGPVNLDYYALYRKYDISGGTPVQTNEVLFDDPNDYEAGDWSSNMVAPLTEEHPIHSFTVWRKDIPPFTPVKILRIVEPLRTNTTYDWYVAALNRCGYWGPLSDVVTHTTMAPSGALEAKAYIVIEHSTHTILTNADLNKVHIMDVSGGWWVFTLPDTDALHIGYWIKLVRKGTANPLRVQAGATDVIWNSTVGGYIECDDVSHDYSSVDLVMIGVGQWSSLEFGIWSSY